MSDGTFVPRTDQDVQADVNVVLDTLLAGERLVSICHERHDSNKSLVIEFALDAMARLRKDAAKGFGSDPT